MKQAIYDIICYVRRDIYKCMLLIAQYTLFFILVGNIILYIDGLNQNKEMFCEKNGYIYVKLVQNSFNSSFVNLWNIPMINEKMEITMEMLKKDSRFLFSSLACNQEINVFLER